MYVYNNVSERPVDVILMPAARFRQRRAPNALYQWYGIADRPANLLP
jgi:hypothetical protein